MSNRKTSSLGNLTPPLDPKGLGLWTLSPAAVGRSTDTSPPAHFSATLPCDGQPFQRQRLLGRPVPPVRTTAPALVGLLLLGLALPALAGTASAPEVTDASDDQAVAGTVPISTQPPAGTTVGLNVDLQAGWVTETADALKLTIQVQGSGSPSASSATAYAFHFETGGKSYDATATMDVADQGSGVPGTGSITPGGAATAAAAAGDHLIVLTVPKSGIGNPGAGAALSNLFITAEGKTGGVETTVSDRAPDANAGTNYVLTGGGGATVTRSTLTNATVSIVHGFSGATTASYAYNWTQGPASASIRLVVQGSGNATVDVKDASNLTIFRMARTQADRTLNLTTRAGTWSITLNYTQFRGNLSLSIEPWTPPAPTGTPTTATSPTRTATSTTSTTRAASGTSTTTSKGLPGLGLALAATGVGLALAARRRLN